eukprot:TRINITY_DN73418_c0_g1_i1.p1 TRINITY_DN73418_c0_g1~~TRINITY_DN73418_c0_g1_i1.p1  ORF type:complete len:577 (+),score=139.48 TRINITY_DN73418_c0_g1_i1:123-1853(+)
MSRFHTGAQRGATRLDDAWNELVEQERKKEAEKQGARAKRQSSYEERKRMSMNYYPDDGGDSRSLSVPGERDDLNLQGPDYPNPESSRCCRCCQALFLFLGSLVLLLPIGHIVKRDMAVSRTPHGDVASDSYEEDGTYDWEPFPGQELVDDEGPGLGHGFDLGTTRGKSCEPVCDSMLECNSFTKCGEQCLLKKLDLTGMESSHRSKSPCVSYYRRYRTQLTASLEKANANVNKSWLLQVPPSLRVDPEDTGLTEGAWFPPTSEPFVIVLRGSGDKAQKQCLEVQSLEEVSPIVVRTCADSTQGQWFAQWGHENEHIGVLARPELCLSVAHDQKLGVAICERGSRRQRFAFDAEAGELIWKGAGATSAAIGLARKEEGAGQLLAIGVDEKLTLDKKTGQLPVPGKATVTVYYDSYNPRSVEFITKQVPYLLGRLSMHPGVAWRFLPAGLSRLEGTQTLCPRGPAECIANHYGVCAADMAKDKAVVFLYCFERRLWTLSPVEAARKCSTQAPFRWNQLMDCATKHLGKVLMAEAIEESKKAQVYSEPHVTLDGTALKAPWQLLDALSQKSSQDAQFV